MENSFPNLGYGSFLSNRTSAGKARRSVRGGVLVFFFLVFSFNFGVSEGTFKGSNVILH